MKKAIQLSTKAAFLGFLHCGRTPAGIERALFDGLSPDKLSAAKLARGARNLSHDIIDSLGELDELTHKALLMDPLTTQGSSNSRSGGSTRSNAVVNLDFYAGAFDPAYWQAANRHLVKKILCEFTHEKIITPTLYGQKARLNHYELRLKDSTYYFSARHYQLDHLAIDADSIRVSVAGQEQALDAMSLIISLK